jgi:hypothetical protein
LAVQGHEGAHSRTIGALGAPAVQALRKLRYGIVGSGRQGHALSLLIAGYQPRQIVIIDPDEVEAGNADAGLAFAACMYARHGGVAKVDALASLLATGLPHSRLVAHRLDACAPAALRLMADCDVIITATDRDPPRLAAALVAAAMLRIHLDVGSLISRDGSGPPSLGADIRLVLPGEDRDLCCLGGFAQADALDRMARRVPAQGAEEWWHEKAGALSSWAALCAGAALRLLEDVASGRLRHSHWLRLTQQDGEVSPRIEPLSAPYDRHCPLCLRSGQGRSDRADLADLAAAALIRAQRMART